MNNQRVAIVTGAASGVAADGASRVADAIGADAGTAVAVACDVSDPSSAAALTTTGLDAYGRLDVVANIAGVGRLVESHAGPFHEWQRTIAVNLTGVNCICPGGVDTAILAGMTA